MPQPFVRSALLAVQRRALALVGLQLMASPPGPDKTKVSPNEAAPAPEPAPPRDFKHYVGVWVATGDHNHDRENREDRQVVFQVVLQEPRFKRLGNHDYLVGTPARWEIVSHNPRKVAMWADGAVVRWIPLEKVVEFYEFDDADGYRPDR